MVREAREIRQFTTKTISRFVNRLILTLSIIMRNILDGEMGFARKARGAMESLTVKS